MLGNPKVNEAAATFRTALDDGGARVQVASEVLGHGAVVHAESITELAHGLRDASGEIRRTVDSAVDALVMVVLGICAAVAVVTIVGAITEWSRGDQ